MQIPSFLLDEWLNHYHFASHAPEFDLASSTGPRWTAQELMGLMTTDERELFNKMPGTRKRTFVLSED